MATTPHWQRIKDRIAARTGLTLDEEIEAYVKFCDYASHFAEAVIMEGNVQHEFYHELRDAATPAERAADDAFYAAFDGTYLNGPYPQSPLSQHAQAVMERYRDQFVAQHLISEPTTMGGRWLTPYRLLYGYSYWNDPEFYVKRVTENSVGFDLVHQPV